VRRCLACLQGRQDRQGDGGQRGFLRFLGPSAPAAARSARMRCRLARRGRVRKQPPTPTALSYLRSQSMHDAMYVSRTHRRAPHAAADVRQFANESWSLRPRARPQERVQPRAPAPVRRARAARVTVPAEWEARASTWWRACSCIMSSPSPIPASPWPISPRRLVREQLLHASSDEQRRRWLPRRSAASTCLHVHDRA